MQSNVEITLIMSLASRKAEARNADLKMSDGVF
jgi:hypothetical protein